MTVEAQTDVSDKFGKGKQLVLALRDWSWGARWGFQDAGYGRPHSQNAPLLLFTFTLYEGRGEVVMGFDVKTPKWFRPRLQEAYPLARAQVFPGKTLSNPITLKNRPGEQRQEADDRQRRRPSAPRAQRRNSKPSTQEI